MIKHSTRRLTGQNPLGEPGHQQRGPGVCPRPAPTLPRRPLGGPRPVHTAPGHGLPASSACSGPRGAFGNDGCLLATPQTRFHWFGMRPGRQGSYCSGDETMQPSLPTAGEKAKSPLNGPVTPGAGKSEFLVTLGERPNGFKTAFRPMATA